MDPVELLPLSFWSKSLLPRVDHREQERVSGTYVVILRLTRGEGKGWSFQGQDPEGLCGWKRSQHNPGNSIETKSPEPWSRREEKSNLKTEIGFKKQRC